MSKTKNIDYMSIRERIAAMLQTGNQQQAIDTLHEACLADNGNADLWLLLAQLSFQLNDVHKANESLARLVELQPANPAAYNNFGIILQQQGRTAEALENFGKSFELEPGQPVAAFGLAACSLDQDNLEDAEYYCRIALDHAPQMAEAHNCMGLVLRRQGRPQEALESLRKALDHSSNPADIHYNIALTFIELDDPQAAIVTFNKALTVDPQHAGSLLNISKLYLSRNELDEALKYAQAASNSNSPSALVQLGNVYTAREDFFNAKSSFEQCMSIESSYGPALLGLAVLYSKTRKYNIADEYFERALDTVEDKALVYFHKASNFVVQNKLDEAMEMYKNATQIKPDWSRAFLELGRVQFELGQHEGAIKSFQSVIEQEPSNSAARLFLSELLSEETDDKANIQYAADLFDAYADNFEKHLTDKLNYRVPDLIEEMLTSVDEIANRQLDILDAGCGTGLVGVRLAHLAHSLIGLDISSKMIDTASKRDVYTNLLVSDLDEHLIRVYSLYDLIVAGDVFVYIGKLDSIMSNAYNALRDNGYIAFSVELMDEDGYRLRGSARYAHSREYIIHVLDKSGFELIAKKECELRNDYNRTIDGGIYVAQKVSG